MTLETYISLGKKKLNAFDLSFLKTMHYKSTSYFSQKILNLNGGNVQLI
jgi:hypothetical protein